LSSSSAVEYDVSSSSSAADYDLSSSSSGVEVSSASVSVSSSSSPFSVSSLPPGTVSLTFFVTVPNPVPANFANLVLEDIADNIATEYHANSTDVEKYIVLNYFGNQTSSSTGGAARRLLQVNQALSFFILGSISQVVDISSGSGSSPSAAVLAVAEFISASVQNQNLTFSNSGASVPPQTITIQTVVPFTSSSSSSGLGAPQPSTSSGLSGGAIAGIVIGVIVGLAVIVAIVIIVKKLRVQKEETSGIQPTNEPLNGDDIPEDHGKKETMAEV